MGNNTLNAEEEALFRSYPYALYFVQSPSTVSRANSADDLHLRTNTELSAFQSPLPLPYSSSRGSNGSYLHEKKISYDLQSHVIENDESRLISSGVGLDYDDDDDDDEDEGGEKGWVRYFYFSTYSSSPVWICLQILWRFIVSLGIALLVFYIVTKPPPPKVSVKIAGIRQFVLGEGADGTGVTTKILTLNCSMNLLIKNKSRFFGIYIQSPAITMSFGHLPLATTAYGPNLYARSDDSTTFPLFVATRNKPMYGAGRAMQDMLDMNKGFPLVIHISLRSNFQVVWGIINPKFHHKAECLLLLGRAYDKKHHTQEYNSRCIVTT